MPGGDAVTIAEAAAALGVRPQRIHQLLREGRLSGPPVPAGRAPGGIGRVWRESLTAEQARREVVEQQPAVGGRHTPDSRTRRESARGGREPGSAQSAWVAVQELKVALDVAREALRRERAQSARLAQTLADLLRAERDQGRRLDEIAQGYSDALTQLLGPETADDL